MTHLTRGKENALMSQPVPPRKCNSLSAPQCTSRTIAKAFLVVSFGLSAPSVNLVWAETADLECRGDSQMFYHLTIDYGSKRISIYENGDKPVTDANRNESLPATITDGTIEVTIAYKPSDPYYYHFELGRFSGILRHWISGSVWGQQGSYRCQVAEPRKPKF